MKRWKSLKPWLKWLFGISGLVVGLFLVVAIVFYYQIRSIRVEDILQRHQMVTNQNQNVTPEALKDSTPQSTMPTLPTILNAPLDKANQFASKPIKSQDALDVASILLKSGLSLKEVYYLTGEAKSNLSNEEKQKIRDLLLSKLTKDEIAALRSITKPYGKGLNILDPNFPIELVGIDDPAEMKKILKELQDKKKSQQSQQAQKEKPTLEVAINEEGDQPTTQVQPSPTSVSQPESETTPKDSPKPMSDPAIIATYKSKLDSLKSSCQGDINRLVSGVVSAKKGNKDLTVADLQSMFLQKFVEAESKCDSGFNSIVSEAGKAGVSSGDIEGWKQSYHSMKQSAQSSAISQIEKSFSKK